MSALYIVVTWYGAGLLVAPLTYARWFAYWQNKWPQIADDMAREDQRSAVVMAAIGILMGPLSLVFAAFRTRGYGWKARA